MAIVTGKYVTSAATPLPAGAVPQVQAIPSRSTVTVDGQTVSAREQTVTPNASTGAYSFDLIPTIDSLDRRFHYTIRGSYLDPDMYGSSGGARVDVFEFKLYVPEEGGGVGDLVLVETPSGLAWEGATPPHVSMLWLFVDPNYDPDSGAPLPIYTAPDGTTVEHGELVEWSA